MEKECVDHLGNRYYSVREMCNHYGIRIEHLNSRLKSGWSLEEALTTPIGTRRKNYVRQKQTIDHLGNTYPNLRDMCDHYGLTVDIYNLRRKRGWSLEATLEKPVDDSELKDDVCDHLGNRYTSLRSMCDHYGITFEDYSARRADGWSIEKALTVPVKKRDINETLVMDHKGNRYSSNREMCAHYNIPVLVYEMRIRMGWTVEEALTKKC